jgi:hypothetical protein
MQIMRRIVSRSLVWPLLFVSLGLVTSCDETPDLDRDTTPPEARLSLSVWNHVDNCPFSAIFSMNPVGSSDDRTPRNELRVRWDWDNDGTWDTDYQMLDIIAYDPDPLPVGTWTARCEVMDWSGNTDIQVESMPLPAWLPVPPDIVAGSIDLWSTGTRSARVDTLFAGEDFRISTGRRDWVSPAGQQVWTAFFVDGVQVGELGSLVVLPDRTRCAWLFETVVGGIATPGVHEIKVVEDAHGAIAETDEANNITTREVVVINR